MGEAIFPEPSGAKRVLLFVPFSGMARHNVSNAWLLTKRSAVRILFAEPNIFHFEILSCLLVNH